MSAELFDGDNYPTEEALDRLSTFVGTPEAMTELIRSLMRNGGTKLEDALDDFGRPIRRLTLITMGWSGCESVISALHETMFHFLFWESSFRGGLYTYTMSINQWGMETRWGKL